MCGISAIFGKNNSEFNNIYNFVKEQTHRGPDNNSIKKINSNLIFGHNRLKIVDLSNKANQPFSHKNISLIFNGMIYNYLEIKKNITNKFYRFKTDCDTEVILASYIKWGEDCFKKFTGMFSIVLWDGRKKKLYCVRDRLGIKPLYYTIKNKNIYISSEIKPIQKMVSPNINEKVLSNYLNFSLYENKNDTFFQNIKQIEPGYIYQFENDNTFIRKKYWSLFDEIRKKENRERKVDQNLVREKIFSRVNEIKKIYCRSDVKTAAFLSSGLDSFYLTNLLLENDKNLKLLLSFGFFSKTKDEISNIKKTPIMYKTEHKKIKFTCEQFLKNLNKIQKQQEGPWGGPNVFFMERLLNFAKKKNFKVAYNADGADEVFGGYKKYLLPLQKNNNHININYFATHIDGTQTDRNNILKKDFKKKILDYSYNVKVPSKSSIHNHRYLDIVYNKLPRNFRFSDRYSMSNSIELRYPFLDHELIELSFELNKENLIKKTENKILLRKIANNYSLRGKRHINSPLTEWMYKKSMINYINKMISDSPIFDKYYDRRSTLKFIDRFYSAKQKNSFKLWQIINLDLWLRNSF